ncbi:MAG TPA: HAD family hydrolase [Anaeromyxobacteraceae bacterium]|nr:HAD family hydrolase [Anaeromyxobacteraceae bacterium]
MPSSSDRRPGSSRVLLFDVDGTLVHAGGAGRRALERVMRAELGAIDGALARLRLDGMTDRLIVREVLEAVGRPFDDALCDRLLADYVGALREEIDGPGFAVLPGVHALLDELSRAGASLGLCTGNVPEGARIKLARGRLDGFFAWGPDAIAGFADDGEARELLVRAALDRAARHRGHPVAPSDFLVIGDTPRDVVAARAHGVPVLAVATGRYRADELRTAGAHAVRATLEGAAAELLAWAEGGVCPGDR